MPCYDKKLEAVRPLMLVPSPSTAEDMEDQESMKQIMEVDNVIATHELIDLFKKTNVDFNKITINQ